MGRLPPTMDFGKVSNVDRIDFTLPPAGAAQEKRSLAVLKAYRPGPARVRTGCPVWAQKEWLGKIYPLATRSSEYLYHYSRQFGMIELNLTHYTTPTFDTVDEWRKLTPPEFRFCPKWPQQISHHSALRDCGAEIKRFCDSLLRLEDRLGSSFLQLPPGFAPPQLPLLRDFLRILPKGFPICVEFREPHWFRNHALIPEALDLLEQARAGTVITDVAGRRDVAHVSLTVPRVLVRFIGNGLHPTDYTRLDAWMPRLKLWIESGVRELDFCTHEPDNVLAPELASAFVDRFNQAATGVTLRHWTPQNRGEQLGLF